MLSPKVMSEPERRTRRWPARRGRGKLVESDAAAGLKQAIREVLPRAS
ncbi:MAG: hypothetical protein NTZ05_09680 [Chloroflexi bacterium]|nr:hypothetical protein [Chloroflexota bacterium]